MVLLRAVANVQMFAGPDVIHRIDGESCFLITARPVPGRGNEEARRLCREIDEQVLRAHKLPAGFQIECTGSDTDEQD